MRTHTKIENLGFDAWFEAKIDPSEWKETRVARVIAVDRNSFLITDGTGETFAESTGKMLFNADSALDLPAVGDWIHAQFFDDDSFAVIRGIFPRRSILMRKRAGRDVDLQLIAANIDTALIMQSLDADYNINRLERYLVIAREGGIEPLILLSKSDLVSQDELDRRITGISGRIPDVRIESFSNELAGDPERIRAMLVPGRTYCLLGSSGVGKTTLLNHLLGEERYETREVRKKDHGGKHTTARRQLTVLETGAMIIDTPGMRELGMLSVESGIGEVFPEIAEWAADCRYKDCTHLHENGCAVLAALEQGELPKERYDNYVKLRRESAYYTLSYVEKRRRDKKFGKMVKSVMKHKKTNRG